MEILELDRNSMLLIDTQQLWRLTVPAGTMTKISQLPKEIAAHDSGIVMTAHGLVCRQRLLLGRQSGERVSISIPPWVVAAAAWHP